MKMPNQIEAQETLNLRKEQDATEKSWKWESWSSSEKEYGNWFSGAK